MIKAIIPAAGNSKNKIMVNSNLPDAMIPVNGKPVIGYIFDDLIAREIVHISVIINRNDQHTESYLKKMYSSKCHISFIKNNKANRGLGYSIYLGMVDIKKEDKIFICLGDTIYKGKLVFQKNFLVKSKKYEETNKWCFVENKNNKLFFVDKPAEYKKDGEILCGLYFFDNASDLLQIISKIEENKTIIEMKDILEKYSSKHLFQLIEARYWYDCGNIENYYKAKIDFIKHRSFNKIKYNDLYGHITKYSTQTQKLKQEINWYQNIPPNLKIFSPRLIDFDINSKRVSYTTEYYGYSSLADIFVFENINIKIWKIIIKRLFEIMKIFRRNKIILPYSFYHEMYYKKTFQRLDKLKEKTYWNDLLKKEKININGHDYKNILALQPKIEKYIKKLVLKKDMSAIHGDLFMGNILFDPDSRIFKFIDPRGSFGTTSIFGDSKYDIAKLRQSFVNYYDFILSDLYFVSELNSSYTLRIFACEYHKQISDWFDFETVKSGFKLEHIKFIEALLFLSMVPLHYESTQRQIAMYLQGIMLINKVLV